MNRHPILEVHGIRADESREIAALLGAAGEVILEAEVALDLFEETQRYIAHAEVTDHVMNNLRYLIARVRMTGKAFVAILARLGRVFNALAQTDPKFDGIWREYQLAFPAVTGVRDSNEHVEDRARGLHRTKKRTKRIVVQNPTSIVFTENIIGTEYTTLLADGTEGKVQISREVLATAYAFVEQAFQLRVSKTKTPP